MSKLDTPVDGDGGLTREEEELYDRQLRTWGVEAQKRMRQSRLLFVGLDGCSTEVVKNLTLAGVGSITLMDDALVTEDYCDTHWFARGSVHTGKPVVDVCREYFSDMNENVQFAVVKTSAFCIVPAVTALESVFDGSIAIDMDTLSLTGDMECDKVLRQLASFDLVVVSNQCRFLQSAWNSFLRKLKTVQKSKSQKSKKKVAKSRETESECDTCTETRLLTTRSIGGFGYLLAEPIDEVWRVSDEFANKQWTRFRDCSHLSELYRSLQTLERMEDGCVQAVIAKKKKTTTDTTTLSSITDAMAGLRAEDMQETFDKQLTLEQFASGSDGGKLMAKLSDCWGLSVCAMNAMLGGLCANFGMHVIQKAKALDFNILLADLLGVTALSSLLTHDAEVEEKRMESQRKSEEAVVELLDSDSASESEAAARVEAIDTVAAMEDGSGDDEEDVEMIVID